MAEIYVLPDPPMTDIPAMLRRLADNIDDGKIVAYSAACVVESENGPIVYGWGATSAVHSVGLLNIGAVTLTNSGAS